MGGSKKSESLPPSQWVLSLLARGAPCPQVSHPPACLCCSAPRPCRTPTPAHSVPSSVRLGVGALRGGREQGQAQGTSHLSCMGAFCRTMTETHGRRRESQRWACGGRHRCPRGPGAPDTVPWNLKPRLLEIAVKRPQEEILGAGGPVHPEAWRRPELGPLAGEPGHPP